jgi:SMC interacting uncharacterized protein involved in chromosome segregation
MPETNFKAEGNTEFRIDYLSKLVTMQHDVKRLDETVDRIEKKLDALALSMTAQYVEVSNKVAILTSRNDIMEHDFNQAKWFISVVVVAIIGGIVNLYFHR